MKVELVSYYIKKEHLEFFSQKPSKEYPWFAIYLGEDSEHTWLQPIIITIDHKFYISSVQRYMNDSIVMEEPLTYNDYPFGDMVYQGLSLL